MKKISEAIAVTQVGIYMERFNFSNKNFLINGETLKILNSDCLLDKFNDLCLNQKNEIKDKLIRSLDWFLKFILEPDLTDASISLFISLESLLSLHSDPLTGHTDDMAENIALMMTTDTDGRYKYKRRFKNKTYKLRNKIMHHGYKCTWEKDYMEIQQLTNFVVWSLRGILMRLEQILTYGTGIDALREYFDREKLGQSMQDLRDAFRKK